jgi:hypothetical protein
LAGIKPTPARSGRAGYARLNLSATGGMTYINLYPVILNCNIFIIKFNYFKLFIIFNSIAFSVLSVVRSDDIVVLHFTGKPTNT